MTTDEPSNEKLSPLERICRSVANNAEQLKRLLESRPETAFVSREPRKYPAEYKARILREYDAEPLGSRSALLRREGLYMSLLHRWREHARHGRLLIAGKTYRQFTAAYQDWFLAVFDLLPTGHKKIFREHEGLYASHVARFRRQQRHRRATQAEPPPPGDTGSST